MLYHMDYFHNGDIEARADRLEFRTVRVTDERGMEKTVKCFVYDENGNRVIWPTQR